MGILKDITCALQRDPAARTRTEVLLAYPGVHALWGHRVSHWLWGRGLPTTARVSSHVTRFLTGDYVCLLSGIQVFKSLA